MNGISDNSLKGLVGVGFVVLTGLQLFVNREEEMVMKQAILMIIAALGLVIPLFWLIGTGAGMTYLGLQWFGKNHKEGTATFNPQLGFTMADGGDPVDKKEKK